MLGLRFTEQSWCWSACGKHPVAKDFIRIGQVVSLGSSLEDWVARGYAAGDGRGNNGNGPLFWRFWARGTGRNELACGVLRDSSDSIGRTYPFLLVGSGAVPSWEQHWDLLPVICENAWQRLEYICTRNSLNLAGIEREITTVRPPAANWRDAGTTREAGVLSQQQSAAGKMLASQLNSLEKALEFRVELDKGVADKLILASSLLQRIRQAGKGTPNTVFIGGTFAATVLAIYWRPLQQGDFAALWA